MQGGPPCPASHPLSACSSSSEQQIHQRDTGVPLRPPFGRATRPDRSVVQWLILAKVVPLIIRLIILLIIIICILIFHDGRDMR
jgi:hypothetical protein